ncbi:MAG TPA: glycosyltransferase [Chloroflexi bacterium]|nr:glycosyltransferase [Chloroflexota bacterium]
MAPALSVLLPCYNAADTLDEALESLAEQTFRDFEVVAVDDGSADATPDILTRWSGRGLPLRVVRAPHRGLVPALKEGLAACRAPLVARMDADDRAHPERFTAQVDFLRSHPAVDVVSCLVEAFPKAQVRPGMERYLAWLNALVTSEAIRREIFVESPLVHPSVVFRKAAVESVGGYREASWAEDYDLWLRLCLRGAHFAKVPRVLHFWRERPQRLTRRHSRYSLKNFLRAKAHYLKRGPLSGRDALILWGAGQMGRWFSAALLEEGLSPAAWVDIDPRKIGRTRRGVRVHSVEALPALWAEYRRPALLVSVGARGARPLIRTRLQTFGLREGVDWWAVA